MSSNTEQTQQEPQQAQQQQQTDEHNVPLWILSPSEEKTLLKEHQTWTESMCDKQFADFAECCKQYPMLFPWRCTKTKEAMIECVGHYGSTAMFGRLREEYIERKIAYRTKTTEEDAKSDK